MYNNIIVILLARCLPIFAAVFVICLLIYKMYIKVRSKFNIKVNCWFCNQDARIPYPEQNSWNCPNCEQYNGFNEDGDYNRDLTQQRDCSGLSQSCGHGMFAQSDSSHSASAASSNGFCDACNEAQRLKIEKLSKFEPKVESRFEQELKVYTAQLEEQYSLCATCDRHLHKVLRDKKKMVLGSKFLDIIIRGAELLKQPHFTRMQKALQHTKMRRVIRFTVIITALNIFCLLCRLPIWTHNQFVAVLGETVGKSTFIAYSHILTVTHLLKDYLCGILQIELIAKLQLLFRTLVMMLMYTLGLTLPRIASLGFTELFTIIYPYAMIGQHFWINSIDGFKFSRFTLLLLYWSLYATGLCNINLNLIMLISCIITLALCLSHNTESMDHENSFHKLCPDEYLSDETMSLLSEELNCSQKSPRSYYHNSSSSQRTFSNRSPLYSPDVSEMSTRTLTPSNQNYLNGQPNNVPFAYPKSSYSRSPITSPRSSLFYSPTNLYNGQSCQQPLPAATPMTQDQLNNSFHSTFTAPTYPAAMLQNPLGSHQFQQPMIATVPTPLNSSFSISSNSMYQHQQQPQITPTLHTANSMSSLKLATHFSANNLNHLTSDTNAWLLSNGVGYTPNANSNQMLGNTSNGFMAKGNLSRTSSLSSGIESQFGSGRNTEAQLGFESFENNDANISFRTQPSLLSPRQPIGFRNGENNEYGFERDTFNLSTMNKHLPSIRRGDLLRKWSENKLKDMSQATNSH